MNVIVHFPLRQVSQRSLPLYFPAFQRLNPFFPGRFSIVDL
jgi:hypothetical protein